VGCIFVGEDVQFVWGKVLNLCAGKVVGWVEFVCGEGGRVG